MCNAIDKNYSKVTGKTDAQNRSRQDKVSEVRRVYQSQGHDLAELTLDIEYMVNQANDYAFAYNETCKLFYELFDESVAEYRNRQL